MSQVALAQIAMSVSDLAVSGAWYESVFDLVQAGGAKFSGDLVEQVTGVAGVDMEARWLIDGQGQFQYELFKVNNPPARALPGTWSAADEGYAMIGIYAADFDATVARAIAFGSSPLSPAIGRAGDRRVCVKDPDGILIEVMEGDVRQDQPRERPWSSSSAFRFVTIVVPDPDEAAAFLREAFGLTEAADLVLHEPEHYALWGLPGAIRSSRLLWAGDILVELVRYEVPKGRARPEKYRLTDIGLLNVAYLFPDRPALQCGFAEAQRLGATPNAPQIADFGGFAVMYAETRQNTSIEMLHVDKAQMKQLGFEPWDSELRVTRSIELVVDRSLIWSRLIGDEPIFGTVLADECRRFNASDNEKEPAVGSIFELRCGKAWWLERVVAIEPGAMLTLRSEQDGSITSINLISGEDSSTVIGIKMQVVPSWGDADQNIVKNITRKIDRLAEDINKLFPGDRTFPSRASPTSELMCAGAERA